MCYFAHGDSFKEDSDLFPGVSYPAREAPSTTSLMSSALGGRSFVCLVSPCQHGFFFELTLYQLCIYQPSWDL